MVLIMMVALLTNSTSPLLMAYSRTNSQQSQTPSVLYVNNIRSKLKKGVDNLANRLYNICLTLRN